MAFTDIINGTENNDELWSTSSKINKMYGFGGDDIIRARPYLGHDLGSYDYLYGGSGNDTLYGFSGDDELNGEDGNDKLFGGEGKDILNGGNGDDFLYANPTEPGGYQLLRGDSGNDTFVISGADGTTIDDTAGVDTLVFGGQAQANFSTGTFGGVLAGINIRAEIELFRGSDSGDVIILKETDTYGQGMDGGIGNDILWGNAGSEFMLGGEGNDSIKGYGGNDRIDGGNGNDFIYAGAGTNTVFGGNGNDEFLIDSLADMTTIGDVSGTDTLQFTNGSIFDLEGNRFSGDGLHVAVAQNVIEIFQGSNGNDEIRMKFASTKAVFMYGNDGGDILSAGAGNDRIEGGIGVDLLGGSAGDDTLRGGNDPDGLWGGEGADILDGGNGYDFARYDFAISGIKVNLESGDGISGEAKFDQLLSIEGLAGSAFADTLVGNALFNVLNGSGGNDTLRGLVGNDLLTGDDGNDLLFGGEGADVIEGGAGTDIIRFDDAKAGVDARLDINVGVLGEARGDTYKDIEGIVGSSFKDMLVGDAEGNTLKGGKGNDTLRGNGGNDILIGGEGRDGLIGGAGVDKFDFNVIADFGKTLKTRDVITDFVQSVDRIDLATLDASTKAANNNAFSFIGNSAFHKIAGELRAAGNANGSTIVSGDLDGNGIVDFQIELKGLFTLTAADFIL